MSNLIEGWRINRLGFDEVLKIELGSYYQSRMDAMASSTEMFEKLLAGNCPLTSYNPSFVQQEFELIYQLAREAGIPEALRSNAIVRFWKSSKNCNQPFGRILAYLFAALAGQIKGGRLEMPTAGFLNDAQAISAYAPYVDAMFIDKECAELLRHPQCLKNLNYKAQVFSFSSADKFITYLRNIVDSTPENVRAEAELIYGF